MLQFNFTEVKYLHKSEPLFCGIEVETQSIRGELDDDGVEERFSGGVLDVDLGPGGGVGLDATQDVVDRGSYGCGVLG